MGVSEDPYAESRKEREGLIALRKEQAERQPMKELREFLLGVSETKPGYGIGMALGSGEKRRGAEADRFNALQDAQKLEEIKWLQADEKEKQAQARGDSKALLDAQQEKDKLNYNIAKLSHEKENFLYLKVQGAINANPDIKRLNDELESKVKLGMVKPGTPQYQWYVNQIEAIKDAIYAEAGVKNTRVKAPEAPPFPAKEKPGEKSAAPAAAPSIPTVTNEAEYNKLQPGQKYKDPQGNTRTKS